MSASAFLDGLDPLAREHWQALQAGELRFQRCSDCSTAWLPATPECAACLGDRWSWETASGAATLVSWVVYHRAFANDFVDDVPYAVALVELAEGPRLVARLDGVPGAARPVCDAPLRFVADDADGLRRARFALA